MTDWIKWEGGLPPVKEGELVDIKQADGHKWFSISPYISHWGCKDTDEAIIAYRLSQQSKEKPDPVNSPSHYTSHPSGIECIQVTEHMPFCIGNAIKYLWRAGLKGDAVEDLKKAAWYINREIERVSK